MGDGSETHARHSAPDPWRDVVEETVALAGRELRIVRPRDVMELLDEGAFDQDEFLPYWAELWPSGIALARAVAERDLAGTRVLELGCGLGLSSIAAALAGATVLATDWSTDAVAFTRANADRNAARVETAVCSWTEPGPLLTRAPWDLVLAADVLYERRGVDQLLELLPSLVDGTGEVWLADPGRPTAAAFLEAVRVGWRRHAAPDPETPQVTLHRLHRTGAHRPR